ncbi:hypothetical protein GYA49_01250 [Candidatus Beckwithbacteria bacterium]|nr:hypothetical protein [Candidatus Beckwithbacteria bacterium]
MEKIITKKAYLTRIAIGTIFLFLGLVLRFFTGLNETSALTICNIGFILILISTISWVKNKGKIIKDERSLKISRQGLTYSWTITYILLAILFWIDELNLAQFTINQILGILLSAMSLTGVGFQIWLNRKGDVE